MSDDKITPRTAKVYPSESWDEPPTIYETEHTPIQYDPLLDGDPPLALSPEKYHWESALSDEHEERLRARYLRARNKMADARRWGDVQKLIYRWSLWIMRRTQ